MTAPRSSSSPRPRARTTSSGRAAPLGVIHKAMSRRWSWGANSSTHGRMLTRPGDTERQRQGEPHAWPRVETLGDGDRQIGAAEHAFADVHQVVMADEAQVAGFAEADAEFAARRSVRLVGNGFECRNRRHAEVS